MPRRPSPPRGSWAWLLFVTLAILIFNFFPVTAVMIVVTALLNDASILSIAYDNVHYEKQPEAWNMRLVIGMATVLGVVGPVAAFGLFYLGDRVYHLDHAHLQTLMYLMLSVAGSMTIYLTRTRGPFWSIRPARILVLAVTGAEVIATLVRKWDVQWAGGSGRRRGASPALGARAVSWLWLPGGCRDRGRVRGVRG